MFILVIWKQASEM